MSIFEFDSNPLIFQSRFYVTGLFNNYLPAICKFHNIHHTLNIDDNENASVTIVSTFLDSRNVAENYMPSVKKLILATKRLEKPLTLAEEIICDANTRHLGTEDYFNWSALLKEEFELKNRKELSDKEWNHMNICFFNSHRYFTDYAQKMWGGQKLKNLNLLKAGK
jgi:hypothetical protein